MPSHAELSAALWACDQRLALRATLEAERKAAAARLAQAREALRKLRRQEALEAEDAQGLRRPGPTAAALLLVGKLGERRSKEEREAMRARLAVLAAEDDAGAAAAAVERLDARLAALQGEDGTRAELLDRKRALLAADAAFAARLDPLLALGAALEQEERETRDAMAKSVSCRRIVEVLESTNPHGPVAGKVDFLLEGFPTLVATWRKHRNRLAYGGIVWMLREALRELDASPIVEAPELVEAIRFPDSSPDLRTADYATDLGAALPGPLGSLASLAGLAVDFSLAYEVGEHRKADLAWMKGKLFLLEERLEARLARIASTRADVRGKVEALVRSA